MKPRTKILPVLAAIASFGALAAAPAEAAPAFDTCTSFGSPGTLVDNRQITQFAAVSLYVCGSPTRPGVPMYRATLTRANTGDYLQMAYKPYYSKGYVTGSTSYADEFGLIWTQPYYGNPGELQACAHYGGTLYCTW